MTSTLPQGPYGFVPVRSHAGGFAPRADASYNVASNYGTNIYLGDMVSTTGTGRNIQAAAATKLRGVFKGISFTDSFGNARFEKIWLANLPVNTNFPIIALVYDDPSIIFKAQVGGGNLLAANLNAFYAFGGQANGSTLTGASGEFVNFATHTGTANANVPLFALNLTQIPGNDYSGFTELEVMIAQHELAYGNFGATGT
jgi:hypothetical protein